MASRNTPSSGICHLAPLPSENASISSRVSCAPGRLTTATMGRSSHLGCGMPTQAAIATAGCALARFSIALEVAVHDPWATDQQVPVGLAIPGQFLAIAVHDLHVDTVDRAALFLQE